MCGIAGVFAYGDQAPAVERAELEAMNERMRPRGPDAGGVWLSADARVGLAARRLAIIDLSDEGIQPMTDVDGELRIVFNGEIYNHRELRGRLERFGARFHSTSDTEVLLQLYRRDGEGMVDLLHGMFAFAIWDTRTRRLFMARDPYGIKPLFVADDGATLRFASTVKTLLAGGQVSAAHDLAGIAGFWLLGSVPEPFTIHTSIRAVEAGTCFRADERGVSNVRRFYSIARIFEHAREQAVPIGDLVEPATLLREFITDSLRFHLVSDVPVGAFLSSGIDSTALTALAAAAGNPPRTVTLTFEEMQGRVEDEAPLAERFADERGLSHTSRMVTREEFRADVPRILDAMDQPTIDGVNTWFVSKAAAETGLKVAISGLGGDELFGSYPAFRALPRLTRLARVPLAPLLARAARNPKAKYVGRYARTYAGAYLIKRGLFMPDELPALMGPDAAEEGLRRLDVIDYIASKMDPDPQTTFGRVATLESSLYMRNQLLRDTDWASMAHSLEVRTPLVDAPLLRQVAPLLLLRGEKCKQYFAASPRPPLPQWLRERPKTGFSVPLPSWMELPPDGTSTRMRSWARVVAEAFGCE
jgi:asparagine synthase (glutamine-hydrolysing)